MQQITPCLWFDTQALEAAQFYVSLFKNSKLGEVSHYGEGMPMPKGTVLTVAFELDGRPFTALNGGPVFKFTEAVSLAITCDDQTEVDRLWGALTEGGEPGRCGWLKDRYGLSWQVAPKQLPALLGVGGKRAVEAMMGMGKLDIAALEAAGKE
ncbi:VOC family protein [Phenylobacterium montanum]|uniref:VOC family protein n=1 Tax=Phenylobacterium montanum TaxID=2823693 RepID=A0A975G1L9_9CAUL|nr:VOC family protein [Caulobacter sp. S6]QUD89435.1 VOC family protein [Caulobacter sp. S6]